MVQPSPPIRVAWRNFPRKKRLVIVVGLAFLSVWLLDSSVFRRPETLLLLDRPGELAPPGGNYFSGLQKDDTPDTCKISNALKRNPLNVSTYFPLPSVVFPSTLESPPHLSSILCTNEQLGKHQNEISSLSTGDDETTTTTTTITAVFAFKAARTGSTFFTTVIKKTLQQTRRSTSLYWEPFVGVRCHAPLGSSGYQEKALHTVLTNRCRRTDQCTPDEECASVSANEFGKPWFVTASNPRFFNRDELNWRNIFRDIPQPRIFSLRRTNLILMAYSKFHLPPGCVVDRESKQNERRKGRFDFETMLRCIEHYVIGDQEISSSIAFQAAMASGSGLDPYLVVYEDVMANSLLVQQGILGHLGLGSQFNGTSVFLENAGKNKKRHTKKLCQYSDVDCEELRKGLGGSPAVYPCLWKQLAQTGEGHTWSVPMLPDGTISIRGDCHTLEPLDERRPLRSFHDLYSLPRQGG